MPARELHLHLQAGSSSGTSRIAPNGIDGSNNYSTRRDLIDASTVKDSLNLLPGFKTSAGELPSRRLIILLRLQKKRRENHNHFIHFYRSIYFPFYLCNVKSLHAEAPLVFSSLTETIGSSFPHSDVLLERISQPCLSRVFLH